MYTSFSSDAGLFKIDLPSGAAPMTMQNRKIETSAGEMDMDFYLSYGENKIFMVGVLPHGMPEISETLTLEGLRYSRDMLGRSADILESDEFIFNGRPAVSLRYKKYQGEGDIYAYGMITDAAGIQYQIQVASPDPEAVDDDEALRFQLSFRYTGGPQDRIKSLKSDTVVK